MDKISVMIRIGKAFVAAFMLFGACSAHAVVFQDFQSGADYHLYENSIVAGGASLEFQNLFVESPLILENRGEISSDIFIAGGCEFYFQNSGAFYGDIYFGENSRMIQVIKSPVDLGTLSLANDGSFFVLVQRGGALALSDIRRFSPDADKIILDGATIMLGGTEPLVRGTLAPIEIRNEIWIDLRGIRMSDGMILISNVRGDGAVNILAQDAGQLYFVAARRAGDDLVLDLERETDYSKIFAGDPRGTFLNNARAAGTSAKLFERMDRAASKAELGNIMANSIMFNPAKLMHPAKLMARFRSAAIRPQSANGADGKIIGIFGNGLALYAGEAGVGFSEKDMSFGASLYAGEFSESGLEDFAGKIYGGSLRVDADGGLLRAAAEAGVSFAQFETGELYGAGRDPNGLAFYGSAELGGTVFKRAGFYALPFVRARFFTAHVSGDSDSEFAAGIGARAGYREEIMGLAADYSAYGMAETDGMQAGVRAEFMSHADGVGANFDAAAMRSELGWFYKFLIGARVEF